MIPLRSRRSSRRGSARSAATATARGTCAACSSSRPRSSRRCAALVPRFPSRWQSPPAPPGAAAPRRSCSSCCCSSSSGAGPPDTWCSARRCSRRRRFELAIADADGDAVSRRPVRQPSRRAGPRPVDRAWPRRRPSRRPRLATRSRSTRCRSGHGTTRCSALKPPARSSNTLETSFDGFSYARADPARGADGDVFWLTAEGGLRRWSYTLPRVGQLPGPCRLPELRWRAPLRLPHRRRAHRVP